MINVPMTPQGPDMDLVEKLVSEDEAIKGYLVRTEVFQPAGLPLLRRNRPPDSLP